jgi:hypothetical protein
MLRRLLIQYTEHENYPTKNDICCFVCCCLYLFFATSNDISSNFLFKNRIQIFSLFQNYLILRNKCLFPTTISLVCMTFYRHKPLNPFICSISLLWLIVLISSSSGPTSRTSYYRTEPNSLTMDFESLANTILPLIPVTIALENTGQIIKQATTR